MAESGRPLYAALAACALAAVGCGHQSPPPPAPPAIALPQKWPTGRAPPIRITDELTLSIPLTYQRSAIDRDPHAPPSAPAWLAHQEAHFDFFLPGFTGYTLQNYRNEEDDSKVEVVYLHAGDPQEAEPDAAGEYPPNMLKRALKESLDPQHAASRYGLTCYPGRTAANRLSCFGRRADSAAEDIMVTVPEPPYPEGLAFPQLQARYFSKRYGGVRIAWRTHVRNFARWREIDAQIWRFIDTWRDAPEPEAPPAATPAPATLNRS